jgi:hypothetical protein
MTIEKITTPYEILIRLGPNGYEASHVKDLVRLVENGEDLSVIEGMARPVTLAECQTLLGKQSADLIEKNGAIAAECAAKDQQIAALRGELDELKASIAALQSGIGG